MICEEARYAVDAVLFAGGGPDVAGEDVPERSGSDQVVELLPPEARRHVTACTSCREYLDDMVVVADRLNAAVPAVAPRGGLKAQVMAKVDEQRAAPAGTGSREPQQQLTGADDTTAGGGETETAGLWQGWGRTAAAASLVLVLGLGGAWGANLLQRSRQAGGLVTEAQTQITAAARVVAQQARVRPNVELRTPEGQEAGRLYFYEASDGGIMVVGHLTLADRPDPGTVWIVWREQDDGAGRLGPVPVQRSGAPGGTAEEDSFFVFNLGAADVGSEGPLPFRVWLTEEDVLRPDQPSARGIAGTP